MAYNKNSLTRIGSLGYSEGEARGKYGYITADAIAAVTAAGYFNLARDRLLVGDQIDISAVVLGTPIGKSVIVTAVPLTGDVTIAAFS